MPKICGITTKSNTIAAFMLRPLNALADKGFDCYAISNIDVDKRFTPEKLGSVKHIPIKIKWGYMNPIELLSTIYKLYKIFKKERFDIIQYATMNAALCSSIAGALAKVPVRINLLWGLDYKMFTGIKRLLYYTSTKIICRCSTVIQPDSKGNLNYGIEHGLFKSNKAEIIFNGSACGLNLERFDIRKRGEWRKQVWDELGLYKYNKVLGFVGSINFDKGIDELLGAFFKLDRQDVALLLVGNPKGVHTINQDLYKRAQNSSNIYILGRKPDPEKYFASLDFHILASYAEGFGMVILEAAGLGTPSIITNIPGPTDFIKDGINGFVCDVKSVDSLFKTMHKALELSSEEYGRLADNAYQIVKRDFDSEVFLKKYVENRIELYNQIKK